MKTTTTKPKVFATYSRLGYVIHDDKDRELYQAGNHYQDSQAFVDANSPAALSLRTLRKYARQTGQEWAEEIGGVFAGITREQDRE